MKKIILIVSVIFFISCRNNDGIFFNPMANFPDENVVCLDMDLKGVVNNGIVIPSASQAEDGKFVFTFNAEAGQYYKIFYQNESYKFDDDNPLNNENFYGSWEDVNIGFKKVEATGLVTDSFRIVGNPRDERKYYGSDLTENSLSETAINNVINSIRNTPEWLASIEEKAKNNGYDVDRQLYLDAIWIINDNKNRGDVNNRFKRNPRVGEYSFMLVLCDEKALNNIPDYIKNISLTDENGDFVNPYSYFSQNKNNDIEVIISDKKLKTRAVITPEYGIFLDEMQVKTDNYTVDNSNPRCSNSDEMYSNALYKQFLSHVSQQYTLRNIPLIKDVVSDDEPYTMKEYEEAMTKYDSSQLQYNYPVVTDRLGSTVKLNDDNSISLVNPGCDDVENLQKESTGIMTRVGFTYGKYRGKIKFPVMLNEENIWNGLTYAFWLIYQDEHAWNNRRTSTKGGGYIDKNDDSESPVRHHDYHYSEIDIEIVKASRYWPKMYYDEKDTRLATENPRYNNEIMYCCTNWDLATREPNNFASGINRIPYMGREYDAMRWTDMYKALTLKSPISNDVFKEDYYYYEIEWRPNEIIWRVGPSPEEMVVVGYMNDEYTAIPDNQMVCIVTQEYHYSEWWPPIVFEQGLIPYNKTDIEGRVYEIVIE
ncbi:MAG: hypothetical protein E7065_04110 [Lentimicrobiaceae bacterium]|nr:hypothetical protein [Lentimicrobiaceae bacterium]